ncbi:cytochrome P450 [Nocardioides sp. BGMRC 2183]|nr:cytochrome P450 [Nocardioides sp. BGMRC 2183]
MTTTREPIDAIDARLQHFNYFDQTDSDQKWELFDHARTHAPVVQTDDEASGGPFYLLTRYEDVRHVMEDWETFSSTQSPLVATGVPSLSPIDDDPPFQADMRKLLNPLFSRSALAPYEQPMQETATALIDEWIHDGRVEILNRFAWPYIGRMLIKVIFNDLTEDELNVAQEIALEVAEAATPEVFARLFSICAEYLANAKERGITGDGVLARLVNGTVNGEPIPTDKQIGCLGILVLGGLDTTRAAIGNITYRLTQQPGLEERLRDPAWVRRDMDEFLRLDSPVGAMARVATRDVEIHGVQIRKGERVQARFDAANRDPEKFADPGTLHFDEARGGHAAFGMGVHRCLGSNMARMQIEIAFAELLSRIKNLRLAPDAEIVWASGQSNCLHAVNIEFDRV